MSIDLYSSSSQLVQSTFNYLLLHFSQQWHRRQKPCAVALELLPSHDPWWQLATLAGQVPTVPAVGSRGIRDPEVEPSLQW